MPLRFSTDQEEFLRDFEPPSHCVLVTIWLDGALPAPFLKSTFEQRSAAFEAAEKGPTAEVDRAKYMAERAHFQQISDALESQKKGPDWLWQTEPMRLVEQALREMDGAFFRLHAFSILPNGAHFLIDFEAQLVQNEAVMNPKTSGLIGSLRLLKGATARTLNAAARREAGHFWAVPHAERRIERADHFFAAIDFVLQSPVRAGLCDVWQAHEGSWVEPLFLLLG